jgi:hypothetical protein
MNKHCCYIVERALRGFLYVEPFRNIGNSVSISSNVVNKLKLLGCSEYSVRIASLKNKTVEA